MRPKIDGEVFHSFILVTDAAKAAGVTRNSIAKAIERGSLRSCLVFVGDRRKHAVDSRDLSVWMKKRASCDKQEASNEGYSMTVLDAAKRCGKARNTVAKALHQGTLRGKKVGTGRRPEWRVRPQDVDAWRAQTEANIHRSHGGGRPKAETKPVSRFGNAKWRALSDEHRPLL